MGNWAYTKGLHDLGNAVYAYLQPSGSWGWSNAGLITDGDTSLLVDTLYDLKLTQDMLDTMRKAVPAAASIDIVANTHANGDHCYGNQLVANAQIIATKRAAQEMLDVPPEQFAMLLKMAPQLGQLGEFLTRSFGAFDFESIILTPPTTTFDGGLTVNVGNTAVYLQELGPAHTRGDMIVYLPQERVAFTGDILFIGGHPIMWAGPISNWMKACDTLLALDIDIFVPGHGPITDKHGVMEVKSYLEYVFAETRTRYEAGMPAFEAAKDIALEPYAAWSDSERIAVTVASIYRELSGDSTPPHLPTLLGQMAELALGTNTTMQE